MNPSAADRVVLRALSAAGGRSLSLAALHAAVAADPESDAMQTFVAEVSAALVRLLMSGAVTVEREDDLLVYRLRDPAAAQSAAVA